MNKKFVIPSEKVVRTKLFPDLYLRVQYKLKTFIEDNLKGADYSLSCDVWSSKALDSYLGVIIHFVTKDFERKVVVLRCLPYNRAHTGKLYR